jgi:hypothetical protein
MAARTQVGNIVPRVGSGHESEEIPVPRSVFDDDFFRSPAKEGVAAVFRTPPSGLDRDLREEYRNYKAFVERAAECFGDDLTAGLWLSTPSVDLDGKVPMQVAQEVHYSADELERIFEPIFVRIEHGIYW